jgi:predicted MPP superfamily phosphohydrolase
MLTVKDGIALLIWLSHYLGTSWHLPFSPTVRSAGLSTGALVLGIFGTWQSLRVPDVRTVEIALPRLPRDLDGFTIVQLSDIHMGPLLKENWLRSVVAKTNALHPDIVALTGDMIDGYPDKVKRDIAPLAELHAKHGVYGVTGNHEYYFHAEEWLSVFKKLGIIMLHNEHRIVSVNGADLVIAGIPDRTELRFGGPGPDIRTALKGAPDTVRVLLAHQPRDASGNTGVDIQLSGHTHGGLLFFMKWLMSIFNGGLVLGLYNIGGMTLYVSPGTGLWSGFSCRVGVPAEISRIVLRGQSLLTSEYSAKVHSDIFTRNTGALPQFQDS